MERRDVQGAIRALDVSSVVDVIVVRADVAAPILAVATGSEADLADVKTLLDPDSVLGVTFVAPAFVTDDGVLVNNSPGGFVAGSVGQAVNTVGNINIGIAGRRVVVSAGKGGIASVGDGIVNVISNSMRASGAAVQHFYGPVRNLVAGRDINISSGGINGAFKARQVGSLVVGLVVPALSRIKTSGMGTVRFYGVNQDEMELRVSGTGSVHLEGQVRHLDAKVSGTGSVKAKNLGVQVARLRVSGTGNIRANVTQEVDAKVSGVGGIRVSGNPAKRRERVTGMGDIEIE